MAECAPFYRLGSGELADIIKDRIPYLRIVEGREKSVGDTHYLVIERGHRNQAGFQAYKVT